MTTKTLRVCRLVNEVVTGREVSVRWGQDDYFKIVNVTLFTFLNDHEVDYGHYPNSNGQSLTKSGFKEKSQTKDRGEVRRQLSESSRSDLYLRLCLKFTSFK